MNHLHFAQIRQHVYFWQSLLHLYVQETLVQVKKTRLKYPQYTYRQEGSGAQYPRKRVMAHRRIGKGVREWKGRRNMIWMCPITVNGAADAAHPEIGHNIHVFGPRSMTLRSSPSRNPTHKSSSHNISPHHILPSSPPHLPDAESFTS